MRRIELVIAAVFGILLPAAQSHATPETQSWHRERLLGANEKEFFFLKIERDNPGSYYEYTDRVKICRAPHANPAAVEEVLIREIRYVDSSATGRWIGKELSHKSFDLTSFLLENHIQMAFQAFGRPTLVVDSAGVFVQEGTFRAQVLSRSEFLSQMPEIAHQERFGAKTDLQRTTAVEVVELRNRDMPELYYYTVYSEIISGGDCWFEDLLVIPAEKVKTATEIVGRARSPR
jgi:hypothetical protein